ncbi:hypothetical protein IT411_00530, partial [Candidatus Peregrinibacteria bacterium]|nr:hypothetical protein [Candidatus Peregrinibacteria bacterium]
MSQIKEILGKYNAVDLMNEKDKGVVETKIENLKTSPTNMTVEHASKVLQAWSYYDLIREHARRMLDVGESMREKRKEGMTETETVGGMIKDKLHGARENWDKLSGKEKLLFGAVALFSAVWLARSQNETIKGIRDTLFTGVKVLGAGWVLNKVWYLFTGESAVDTIMGSTKRDSQQSEFYKTVFNTDERGAELFSKGLVNLSDNGFSELASKYTAAKKEGKKTIEGVKMPGEEAYTALDIFFSKYPVERLALEYGNYKPPISFGEVVTIELSKDPSVKMKEKLTTRVWEGVSDTFKKGYNYFAATAPATWLGDKYRSWFGTEPTKEAVSTLADKFKNICKTEADLPAAIEATVANGNKGIAKEFVDTNATGLVQSKYSLKYRKASDGYLYIISDQPLSNTGDNEKSLDGTLKGAVENTEKFITETYKVDLAAANKRT